ncbi:MAG: SRPBCC family protein [Gemmataceae bacterium]|nr:SRPBCC family protein [Gemmataceae bacterium]
MGQSGKLQIVTRGDCELVITRQFDAPRSLVWDAMSKPEFLKRWMFSPPGWTMAVCRDDGKVGGTFRWEWHSERGVEMAMHGVIREYEPPARCVRTETFEFGCNSQAGEQLATMELSEKDGKTFMTLTVVYPSQQARDGTIASGMEQGMAAGYDKLDALLRDG